MGGVELFHDVFRPILLPALKTPSPYCYRCPLGKTPADCSIDCANELDDALARAGGRVCAVVIEPGVQAAAGMLVLPDGFLSRAADACRRHGALLILDEVATGFGRTGTLFACQREGVTPDLLCVAKGLTGGYLPVAATLATDAVYDAFLGRYEEFRHFFHGHTYTGNALGCAAALATLRLLSDGAIVGSVERKASVLREALAPLRQHPHVGDIRQSGLMCGIEIVANRAGKTTFPPGDRMGYRICMSLRSRGVFLRPLGDILVLMPPLSSTETELTHLADAVGAALVEHWVHDLLVTGTDTALARPSAAALIMALRHAACGRSDSSPRRPGSSATRLQTRRSSHAPPVKSGRSRCRSSGSRSLAPAVAADRAGVRLDPAEIESRIRALRGARCSNSGRGRRAALPLAWGYTRSRPGGADGTQAVVVGRAGLGTLNHLALTVAMLRGRGCRFARLCSTVGGPPRISRRRRTQARSRVCFRHPDRSDPASRRHRPRGVQCALPPAGAVGIRERHTIGNSSPLGRLSKRNRQ